MSLSLDYQHANKILSKSSNILWLGDCQAAEDIDFLRKSSIKTVITAAVGIQLKYPSTIQHYVYPLQDIKTENMLQHFEEIVARIDRGLRNGGVLVHCGAGVSRSATIVIAFLIKFYKMNFLDALRFTKTKRPQICPNLGFELQLKKYASNNIKSTSQTLQKPKPLSSKTQSQPREQSKEQLSPLFSQLSSLLVAGKNANQQLIKSRLTQPKGWRISYSIKPQIASSSLDPKTETEFYIKKMAKFRFGQTNTSKWGLY